MPAELVSSKIKLKMAVSSAINEIVANEWGANENRQFGSCKNKPKVPRRLIDRIKPIIKVNLTRNMPSTNIINARNIPNKDGFQAA